MRIKTTLILAATAISLLSTQAFAFRDMGDAGGDSAFAIPEQRSSVPATNAYASAPITRAHRPVQRQHRAEQHR